MHISSPTRLSKRETEILALISRGLTSREIGQMLYLSTETINTHRRNILRKTGAKNILSVLAAQNENLTWTSSEIAA